MLRTADKRLFVAQQLANALKLRFPYSFDLAAMAITPTSRHSLGQVVHAGGNYGTNAWPAANRAIFVPFRVPYPVTVSKLVCGTGTGTTGNQDIGIYNAAGTLIVSTGSQAKTTASSERIFDVTDVTLKAGMYYLAMSADGTQPYQALVPTNLGMAKMLGLREMASAFALPSTATFATLTSAYIPLCGAYLSPMASPGDAPLVVGAPCYPPLNVITPFHPESWGGQIQAPTGLGLMQTVSGTPPAANRVMYYPFTLAEKAIAKKITIIVGATNTGNVDVGIYDRVGTRLVNSGSTALGTANTLQEFDITDTPLGPGHYYMAITFSSGSGTWFRVTANDEHAQSWFPVLVETPGSFGLPATASPADTTDGSTYISLMGVHFDSLV